MWKERLSALDKRRKRILQAGGQDRIEKQHKSGKLTARERIEMLFDPGTFVEVDNFIESRIDDFGLDKKRVPGDGVGTGYGEIGGKTVFVSSEDFTVIGGSLSAAQLGVSPVYLALLLAMGWALGNAVCPTSANTIAVSQLVERSPFKLALNWNVSYVLVSTVILIALLWLGHCLALC